ncbi:MAG: AMP-binding protein, partial [bacterium]|nr:AMP-binding protein [bacterium]
GGDKLKQFRPGNYRLVNNYGPTENTVVSTSFIVDGVYDNIPIGKPVSNTQIYIMDKWSNLQPVGIAGELCLSGDSLARGYLNRLELTRKKFEVRSSNLELPSTLYHTGDLARWLPDGNIEFLGRIDHQVKIRGFRIELGEIENRLLMHPGIKEAVVVSPVNREKERYLAAYIVAEKDLEPVELNEFLSRHLPGYMVPSYFIPMEKIPFTPSGKPDRKALPEPSAAAAGGSYTPPQNEIQSRLVSMWADLLDMEKDNIGIDANFFEIGGDSLKAINLIAIMHKELKVSISIKEFFDSSTIAGVARSISGAGVLEFRSLEPVEKREYYPLSSAQKRLYILRQMDERSVFYNIPHVMTLEGNVDMGKLGDCFRQLVSRHESLRTSFHMIGNQPVQRVHDRVEFEI